MDRTVYLWAAATGKVLRVVDEQQTPNSAGCWLGSCAFSFFSRWSVSCIADWSGGKIKVLVEWSFYAAYFGWFNI